MPGPFPGMGQYLENIHYWRGFHNNLIAELTFQLNAVLPEQFVARSEGRCYVLPQHQFIYPDALLIRSPSEEELPPPIQDNSVVTATTQTLLLFLNTPHWK